MYSYPIVMVSTHAVLSTITTTILIAFGDGIMNSVAASIYFTVMNMIVLIVVMSIGLGAATVVIAIVYCFL